MSIASLLANRCHGNMIRVGQNKFTDFDYDLAQGKMREQMPGRLFGERFNQSIVALTDQLFYRGGYFRIIDCISNIIAALSSFRPKGHIQDQALWFGAFTIRHTDAGIDFQLLDMNAIDHGKWNFGEQDVRQPGKFLSSRVC